MILSVVHILMKYIACLDLFGGKFAFEVRMQPIISPVAQCVKCSVPFVNSYLHPKLG